MTNEELKEKIVDILVNCKSQECAVEYCATCEGNPYIEHCREKEQADALIAAGLRFGENLTATFDHMALDREHELERRLAEAERHAEVAARMAKRACDIVFSQEIESEEWDEAIFNYKKDKGIREIGITPNILYDYLKAQAEKELKGECKK